MSRSRRQPSVISTASNWSCSQSSSAAATRRPVKRLSGSRSTSSSIATEPDHDGHEQRSWRLRQRVLIPPSIWLCMAMSVCLWQWPLRGPPEIRRALREVDNENEPDNHEFHSENSQQMDRADFMDVPPLMADFYDDPDDGQTDSNQPSYFGEQQDGDIAATQLELERSESSIIPPYSTLIDASYPLPPFTLTDALAQISTYRTAFAILVYDPAEDTFLAIYSRKHYWSSAVQKLLTSIMYLTHMLRLVFPERFQGALIPQGQNRGSSELVIPIAAGDYPAIRDVDCVRNAVKHGGTCLDNIDQDKALAPILHFGSVFRRPMFPNMIAMPPPEAHHLQCFDTWAKRQSICHNLRAKTKADPDGELIYGSEVGLKWRDLVDQVVWRGTDFAYLTTVNPNMARPEPPRNITLPKDPLSFDNMSPKQAALLNLRKDFRNLGPRWKGVLHTAEAELDLERQIKATAQGKNEARRMAAKMLPWANIKFSQFIGMAGVKMKTQGSKEYRKWEKIDFPAVGESMSLEDLAKYRYHIDIGGGGGTTWSGTIQKLAMPGVLFHHVTPTKDYIHDYMKPWHHYIPIAPDLHDLKEKFDWAESHPKDAFRIARSGTELMKYLSSPKGMEEMFQKDFVEPMRRVMDAYVPVYKTEHKGSGWKKVMMNHEGEGNLLPIVKCTGNSKDSCQRLVGPDAFLDVKTLRKFTNEGGFESPKESLQGNRKLMTWAQDNFVDVNKRPDASHETALFWHIPKSGGTTVKNYYHCTGHTLAHRGGVDPKFGHDNTDELIVFRPTDTKEGKFVNVDTTIKSGILRAKEMGLVQSHLSDIIFTMEPTFAGENLYDKKNKGRILSLFRHPVERMVSKFYYLQEAYWERGYRPDWAHLSLLEWIQQAELTDDNLIVRKLVNKTFGDPIDLTDLINAKVALRRRVVVGLMNQMEESVHRFNIVLGLDETSDQVRQCTDEYFGPSKQKGKKNSNNHPKVEENSLEWKLLAEKEWLDMKLYTYAETLFREQKETIYSFS